jgi:hypothetical protein
VESNDRSRLSVGGVSAVGELVRQQCERGCPPGQLRLLPQPSERRRDRRQALGRQLREPRLQPPPAFRRVELAREPLGRDRIELELALRVAARGEDEQRSPASRVQLGFVDLQLLEDEPGERDEQFARTGLQPALLERL